MSELDTLAPGFLLHTSRREQTNAVVLCSTSEAMLIDPSWDADELEDIAGQLEERGLTVRSGFATHAHHDHLLWHPRFGNTPRYASPATTRITQAERAELQDALGDVPTWMRESFGHLTATPFAPANPARIWLPAGAAPSGFAPELLQHDGHIAGHTAVWIPEHRILVAGDMLSDVELPLPDLDHAEAAAAILGRRASDPVHAYLDALDALEPYARQARVVVPGHGALGTDVASRLERDRAYLRALLAGEDPEDERRANPGMQEWHEHLKAALEKGAGHGLG